MASPNPEARVEDQAAAWAARSAYGEMTEQTRAELQAWLSSATRHRGAYLRAQAALIAMEDAVVQGRPVLASDNDNLSLVGTGAVRRPKRAGFIRWGAIAACVAGLAIVAVPAWRELWGPASSSVETMALADGSMAQLDDGARLSVAMSERARSITLVNGGATFHVAKDATRPFLVRSGEVNAQAIGTVYSVRRLGSRGGVVSVTEGSVLVWAGDDRDRAVLLRAGGTLSLDPGQAGKGASKAAPVQAEVAQITFDDVPISDAVERFNSVQQSKLIVVDPELGKVKLIGLFRADDPEQFARAAATVSGGQVRHAGNKILIQRR